MATPASQAPETQNPAARSTASNSAHQGRPAACTANPARKARTVISCLLGVDLRTRRDRFRGRLIPRDGMALRVLARVCRAGESGDAWVVDTHADAGL